MVELVQVHHDLWPWITFWGHFKVTKVKIVDGGWTIARSPWAPIDKVFPSPGWSNGTSIVDLPRGQSDAYLTLVARNPFQWCEALRGIATDPRHISSSMAHMNIIPTAILLFPRSRKSTVLLPMPSRAAVSRKSKMAAVNTEAAITSERLEITMRFQLPPPHFRPDAIWIWHCRYFPTFLDVGRLPNAKWRPRKPDVE